MSARQFGRPSAQPPKCTVIVPSSFGVAVTLLTLLSPWSVGSKNPSALYTEIDQNASTGTSRTVSEYSPTGCRSWP